MKRHAMATCLLMAALGVCAQTKEQDSPRVINLQEVEVISTRATNSTPVAFTNIGKEQLKKQIAYYMNNAKTILEGLASEGLQVYGGVNSP